MAALMDDRGPWLQREREERKSWVTLFHLSLSFSAFQRQTARSSLPAPHSLEKSSSGHISFLCELQQHSRGSNAWSFDVVKAVKTHFYNIVLGPLWLKKQQKTEEGGKERGKRGKLFLELNLRDKN